MGCDPAVAINFCVRVACLENGSGLFGRPPAGAVLIRTLGTERAETMDESDAGPVVAPAASWGKRGLTLIYQITMPTTDRDGRCHSEVILSFYTGYPQPHESERRPFPMPTAWTMSRIEAVIFIATVVLTASAGTWLAVG